MITFRLIFLIFIFLPPLTVYSALLRVRTGDQSEEISRIVFDLSEKVSISQKTSSNLLEATIIAPSSPSLEIKNQSIAIEMIKQSPLTSEANIAFTFKKRVEVHHTFWIPPSQNHPFYRYVIDTRYKKQAPPDAPSRPLLEKKRIIIDAGHGGRDPGTIGVRKIYEKNVTLAVAKRLAQKLNETGLYTAILLRATDKSMTIAQRLKDAHTEKGDLFISLHADSCSGHDTRGLSIYTLSAIASDKQAEKLAKKENKADLIIGVDLQSEIPEVVNILIDLTKRETMNLSIKFAQCLINKLRDRVFLLRKPHRFADFFILKSADLPSILIELGYLSNPKEALLLVDPNHQETICTGIKEAIESFFKATAI